MALRLVMIREPKELKSLCIEHSRDRDTREYFADEDVDECEKGEKRLDRKFRGRALSLDRVRTKLLKAWQEVELYEAQGEELWEEPHPVCRCGLLVELRRGNGQNS